MVRLLHRWWIYLWFGILLFWDPLIEFPKSGLKGLFHTQVKSHMCKLLIYTRIWHLKRHQYAAKQNWLEARKSVLYYRKEMGLSRDRVVACQGKINALRCELGTALPLEEKD